MGHAEPEELVYNVSQVRPAIEDLIVAESSGSSGLRVVSSVARSSKDTFLDKVVRTIYNELMPKPGQDISMKFITKIYTKMKVGRINRRFIEPELMSAFYQLNPHKQEAMEDAQAVYYDERWDGLQFR